MYEFYKEAKTLRHWKMGFSQKIVKTVNVAALSSTVISQNFRNLSYLQSVCQFKLTSHLVAEGHL